MKLSYEAEKTWQDFSENLPPSSSVVFTNGCFDILHPGHVRYLAAAKGLGTHLVVGLNDDSSISRLKGPPRPINELKFRVEMLQALSSVDLVIPFQENDPARLVQVIQPDILVKGGDYKISDVAGAETVIASGGRVEILEFHNDFSTTKQIDKIKSSNGY